MTGQYSLTKEQQERVLNLLYEMGIDLTAQNRETDPETDISTPFHRDVHIQICSYEDESDEFEMYVQVD